MKHTTRCLVLAACGLAATTLCAADHMLIEAEGFADRGGWMLDTQFITNMGSPYLLAHGMGRPVADAATRVSLPGPGTYRIFVRTKDWVATWKAPGIFPGRVPALNAC